MDYLILIDKFNPLDSEYTKSINFSKAGGKLFEKQTGNQLGKLLALAKDDGITLKIISGYRTPVYQQMLWEKEISENMKNSMSYSQAVAETSKTLALPYSSEHNSGLAVDFGNENDDDVNMKFAGTKEAKWLSCNAARFGFILRYPRLKEHLTGIAYEPWHYRYVGREAAEIITNSGISLEEFLTFYSDRYTMKGD